jgi:hypothetical protein
MPWVGEIGALRVWIKAWLNSNAQLIRAKEK